MIHIKRELNDLQSIEYSILIFPYVWEHIEIHVKRELELFGFEVEVFYYRKEQDY